MCLCAVWCTYGMRRTGFGNVRNELWIWRPSFRCTHSEDMDDKQNENTVLERSLRNRLFLHLVSGVKLPFWPLTAST